MSARARFFVPLLCVVKMSLLVLEGRARLPLLLVEEEEEEGGWERRELRVLEKRVLLLDDGVLEVEVEVVSLGLRVPYREEVDDIVLVVITQSWARL